MIKFLTLFGFGIRNFNEHNISKTRIIPFPTVSHFTANSSTRTLGERQTAIHFAAKYNAVGSLKVLIEHKVNYNVKDYKGRTPLFVAAEMGR